jgi:hypothetical protein
MKLLGDPGARHCTAATRHVCSTTSVFESRRCSGLSSLRTADQPEASRSTHRDWDCFEVVASSRAVLLVLVGRRENFCTDRTPSRSGRILRTMYSRSRRRAWAHNLSLSARPVARPGIGAERGQRGDNEPPARARRASSRRTPVAIKNVTVR